MRRMICFVILIEMVGLGCAFGGTYGGGTGTAENPYQIWDANDLNSIGLDEADWDKHFIMMSDVDMSEFDGLDGRGSFNSIGYYIDWWNSAPFSGVFDGNGKRIINLRISSSGTLPAGFFTFALGEGCVIKDLGFIDPVIEAEDGYSVGVLAGYAPLAKISGCYIEGGSVLGDRGVGGLLGSNYVYDYTEDNRIEISRCYSTCVVTGNAQIGGLVGELYSGSLHECFSEGSVVGGLDAGGLVGVLSHGGFVDCCYSGADVSGPGRVGGLFGEIIDFYGGGYVQHCFAFGKVSPAGSRRGVAGYADSNYSRFSNVFWDVESTGQPIGKEYEGVYGKTTEMMQSAETFLTFSFCSDWVIDEGRDYPRFAWEGRGGEEMVDSAFCPGSGTETDPYLIYTVDHLSRIGQYDVAWDDHFRLMTDIDMNELDSNGSFQIGRRSPNYFMGVFDGNGHVISNFRYISDVYYGGLFGVIKDGVIQNLVLSNPYVYCPNGYSTGALVGEVESGEIINCSVERGIIMADRDDVGGLAGTSYGDIIGCRSFGYVTGVDNVGGLVGRARGTITDSYARGYVRGEDNVGGLVGWNRHCDILRCYSRSSVYGEFWNVGGLVGDGYLLAVIDSFWDVKTSHQDRSEGGEGKTTDEMQQKDTFINAGWDFDDEEENGTDDIWKICEGMNYPRLSWEVKGGDFACPDGVGIEDVLVFATAWLSGSGDLGWDERFDLYDGIGGVIDFGDFGVFADNWGLGRFVSVDLNFFGYWRFDEAEGETARDSSGYGRVGSLENLDDNGWVAGKVRNCLSFDGVDDWVEIDGFDGIYGELSRSVCAWIKTVDTEGEIVSWGANGITGGRWVIRTEESGCLRLEVGGGAIVGSRVVCDGNWHHIGVVLDNDGTPNVNEVKLYVDGRLEVPSFASDRAINTVLGPDVKIGVYGGGQRYFEGLIDEVRIYHRALRKSQIVY